MNPADEKRVREIFQGLLGDLRLPAKGFRVGSVRVHEVLKGILETTGLIRLHYGTNAERAASTDYYDGVAWWTSDTHDLFIGNGTGWEAIGGAVAGTHNLLSATHTDTSASTPPATGAIIRGESNLWEAAGGLYLYDPAAGTWQLRAVGAGNQAVTFELMPRSADGSITGDTAVYRFYGTDFIQDATNYARAVLTMNRVSNAFSANWDIEDGGTLSAVTVYHKIGGVNAFKYTVVASVPTWDFYTGLLLNAGRVGVKAPDTATYRAAGYIPDLISFIAEGATASSIASPAYTRPSSAGVVWSSYWYSGSNKTQRFICFSRGESDPGATPNTALVWRYEYQGGSDADIMRLGGDAALYIENLLEMKEITTPSNPAAGYNRIYFKSDDLPYILDSDGNEAALGLASSDHTREHAMTGTSDHNAGYWKMFYGDGSGDVQEFALGSAGQVVTSNGAAAAPSFQDAAGGSTTKIQDADADTKVDVEEAADEDKIRFDAGITANALVLDSSNLTASVNAVPLLDDLLNLGATDKRWAHVHVTPSIANDHVLTVDQADAADNDFARFTASGIEGLSGAETMAALSGAAAAAFAMNSQMFTGLAAGTAAGHSLRWEQVVGLIAAAGDILYGSAAGTLAKLAKGTDGQVLTLASGLPSWAAGGGGGGATDFGALIPGVLQVHTSNVIRVVGTAFTATKIYLGCVTTPATNAINVTMKLFRTGTGTVTVGSASIAATARSGSTTGLSVSILAGDQLYAAITQVGAAGNEGADLSWCVVA